MLLHLPPLTPLDTAGGGLDLLALCDVYGIDSGDVIVLDSLQRVTSGPENDADTARALDRHTGQPLKRRGVAVVRSDNLGKQADRGARGSAGKRDDVAVEWRMTRDSDRLSNVGEATAPRRLRACHHLRA